MAAAAEGKPWLGRKSTNITFRVALVSVSFIAGLAAVALIDRYGADKAADAFADARAAAGLQAPPPKSAPRRWRCEATRSRFAPAAPATA